MTFLAMIRTRTSPLPISIQAHPCTLSAADLEEGNAHLFFALFLFYAKSIN